MTVNPFIERIKLKCKLAKKWIKIKGLKYDNKILARFGISHMQYRKYIRGRILPSIKQLVSYELEQNNITIDHLMEKYNLTRLQVFFCCNNRYPTKPKEKKPRKPRTIKPKIIKPKKRFPTWYPRKEKRRKLTISYLKRLKKQDLAKQNLKFRRKRKKVMKEKQHRIGINNETYFILDKIQKKLKRQQDKQYYIKKLTEFCIKFSLDKEQDAFIKYLEELD